MKKKARMIGTLLIAVSLLSVFVVPLAYTEPLPYKMLIRPYGTTTTTGGRDYIPPMSINPSSYTGNKTLLVILLKFSDSGGSDIYSRSHYEDLLFNESNPKSLQQYYWKNSYGRLNVSGIVTDWVTSSHTMAYYGEDSGDFPNIDDENAYIFEMAREAVQLADSTYIGLDFSDFDEDSDGFVDNLVIIHAGEGQEAGGDSDLIWSHRWAIQPAENVDGVKASGYATLAYDSPVGVFAHEYGHLLDLPDFYDYTYSGPVFAGNWALMDAGSWNGAPGDAGGTPSHMIAWSKMQLGFIPRNETEEVGLNEEKIITIIPTTNQTLAPGDCRAGVINISTGVYYTVEVRNQTEGTFDEYLPDSGVLISFCNDSARDEVFYGRPGAVVVQNAQPWDTTKDNAPFDIGSGEDFFFKDEDRSIEVELLAAYSNGSYDVRLSYQQIEIAGQYINGTDNWQVNESTPDTNLTITLGNTGTLDLTSVNATISNPNATGVTIDNGFVNYGTITPGLGSNGTSNFTFTLGSVNATPFTFDMDVNFTVDGTGTHSLFKVWITVGKEFENPSFSLISPANGSTFNASDDLVVAGNASDNVYLFRSWVQYKCLEDNITSNLQELSYNGVNVSGILQIKKIGNFSITIKVMDTSGNINESEVQIEIVDEVDPIILFTVNTLDDDPARFAFIDQNLRVIAVVIDNGEVAAVNLSLNGGPFFSIINNTAVVEIAGGGETGDEGLPPGVTRGLYTGYYYNWVPSVEGNQLITVYAEDASGNSQTSDWQITVMSQQTIIIIVGVVIALVIVFAVIGSAMRRRRNRIRVRRGATVSGYRWG